MPANDFLPWSIATGANVMSQTAYAANPAVNLGVGDGIADPTLANKSWRQSSVIASMIAQFIVNETGLDVFDDGNLSTLLAHFITALTAHLQQHIFTNTQAWLTHGSYSFTVPAGVTRLYIPGLVGAGGGGGGGNGPGVTWSSGGGASGGFCSGYATVTPGQVIPIIIGQGGAGGAAGNGLSGSTGGTTSFGSFMSATGGGGGVGGTSTSSGGFPGLGTGASILNLYGANGGDGNNGSAIVQGGPGGASAFGGGGRTSTLTSNVANGLAPGSGGGGIWGTTSSGQTGGVGADGGLYVAWST